MKRIVLLAALLLAACAPKTEPYSVRMVRSEIKRAPEATFLDGQEGGYKWNYTTGLELRSFLDVARAYDIPEFDAYVHAWYDGILDENGAIGGKYKLENTIWTISVPPGRWFPCTRSRRTSAMRKRS